MPNDARKTPPDPRVAVIAATIRRLREATGLTTAAAARKAGLKDARVRTWETGRRLPPLTELDSLAEYVQAAPSTVAREICSDLAAAKESEKKPDTVS